VSLFGPYDPQNVFARILQGELPTDKVFEDEHALAILDLYPQARGHTLVLPKAPARTLLDIEPAALSELIVRVQRVARGVREALQADGLSIMQFNGSPGGQTVFHLHFHIVPRMAGQALSTHGSGGRADPAELADLARRIAAAIREL
jgi:histidine triad (HIT) family protein